MEKQALIGDISEAVGRQLSIAGFVARSGQIVESEAIGRGEVPEDRSNAKRAQKDVGAH